MTTKEAGRLVGVSATVVKRWIQRGWVKAVRAGARTWDVDKESLLVCAALPAEGRGPDKKPRKPYKKRVSNSARESAQVPTT